MIAIAEEKNFENKIKKWLESKGVYRIGATKQKMKVPQIGIYNKNFGCQFTVNGVPDLIVDIKGHCIWLEIKATKGKPSIQQVRIVDNINSWGGNAFIVYPEDWNELIEYLEGVINEA